MRQPNTNNNTKQKHTMKNKMKNEIIRNPNGTFSVWNGNDLIDDHIKLISDAEWVARTSKKL